MLDSVKTQIDALDIVAADYITTDSGIKYIKEKIVELNKSEKLTLEFNYITVAISKNGGLIALCKKNKYRDIRNSRINESIIVMHQDATNRYFIPIDWDYEARYIVSLEFNEKEQLFAFCNDGTILKLDILTQKAVEKPNSYKIKQEGICKAKLFEKGYIVLTEKGTIYLVENLKEPEAVFIISIKEQLGFTNDIDFIGIPPNKSFSGKFEIIITNQKGEGVLHIIRQEPKDPNDKGTRTSSFAVQKNDTSHKNKVVNVSLINSSKLEKYTTEKKNGELDSGYSVLSLNEQLTKDYSETDANIKKDKIGKVTSIAISPSKERIALYVSNSKTVFLFSSQISSKADNNIEKMVYMIDSDIEQNELNEQLKILDFKTTQELLFCGETCVAICGGRFIMIINSKKETIPIEIEENENKIEGYIYSKCISEVDGIRYITEKEVGLITQVSNELKKICSPLGGSYSRELLYSYGYFLSKNPLCNDRLRKIGNNLPEAIMNLVKSAAEIFWTEQDPDTFNRRDIQSFMVKAAQFGKSVVQREEFNFDKFNDICRSIRIINNMRNFPLKPRYLTYEEYLNMDPDDPNEIIKKTMRQLNFKLAHQISNFLQIDDKNVFLRYAICKIKKIPKIGSISEENLVYDELNNTLKNIENIPYIEIAKKCIKYHKYDLAEKFLKDEKSGLVKIPQYLQLGKWDKALELSLKSYDLNVIKVVLDKIYKVEEPDNFNRILSNFPQAHTAVINYFKSIGRPKELDRYLNRQKDQEELLFIALENFFKSQDKKERESYLAEAKQHLNSAKNIDFSFYKNYLSDLENSLKFKKTCFEPEKKLIGVNDTTTFDNSIYDCFQNATPDNFSWIESQNRKHFEISKRKMTILRFKTLAKNNKLEEIDNIIQNETYKKLDIYPLKVAKIFYENKIIDKAVEYAKQETNPDLFDDKIEFILNLDKPLDAVEAVLLDKKEDKNKKIDYINNIMGNKPQLKTQIEDLCDKYNVRL